MKIFRRRTARSKFRIRHVDTWRMGLARTSESEEEVMIYIHAKAEVQAIAMEPREAKRFLDALDALVKEVLGDG